MPDQGLDPDVYTYNAAMKVCKRAGEWKHVLLLFDDMLEPHAGDIRRSPVRPNIITFQVVLGACARAGQREATLGIWEKMHALGVEPDDRCKRIIRKLHEQNLTHPELGL